MNALGRHILVEFSGCNSEVLDDVSKVEQGMVHAAREAGATVVNSSFHHFSPFGVSGVVVIQESHLAIHTWPEYGYAAVDLFTCGDSVDPWISFDYLKKIFEAVDHSALEMHRGSLNLLNRSDFTPKTVRPAAAAAPAPVFQRSVWFTDRDEHQALSLKYQGAMLHQKKSDFQTVRVFQSEKYGRVLALDNAIMCTERDESHYHEMLVHPALQNLRAPKRALVIGGGDGGTLRELLRYASLERIDLVEIDGEVIEAAKTFFPRMAEGFASPKLKLHLEDGIRFVQDAAAGVYDVVIVDGSDPVGPAKGLFSAEFFAHCHRILNDQGVLAAQGESPLFHEEAFRDLHLTLEKRFGAERAHVALFFAPTYPTGMWSVHLATKAARHPIADVDLQSVDAFARAQKLNYYNDGIHAQAFALPGFVQRLLQDDKTQEPRA
ncbi:MAG: polyamine aminopropyltransferase [Bdellovibrionaceae bacterium]|nr:polyamine aminopropyltransferase [Pseudobdellovibrionaceae bacterium]